MSPYLGVVSGQLSCKQRPVLAGLFVSFWGENDMVQAGMGEIAQSEIASPFIYEKM